MSQRTVFQQTLSIILAVLFVWAIYSTIYAETQIPNNDFFQGLFDNDVCTFTPVGHPYQFGIDENPQNEFTIEPGQTLFIQDGVHIQFEEDVILTVQGRIINAQGGGDPFNQIVFERFPDAEAWCSITIQGNDDPLDNDGIVTLQNASFSGGGSDQEGIEEPGLIILTGNDENDHPVLILGDAWEVGAQCNLSNSESNGISVIPVIGFATLTLNNLIMIDAASPITWDGIFFAGDDNNLNPDVDLDIGFNTQVRNCGRNGLRVENHIGNYDIMDSDFSLNGWNGMFFLNDEYLQQDRPFVNVHNTTVSNNGWNGLHFENFQSYTHIDNNCGIEGNHRNGILHNFESECPMCYIENCTIADNWWDGIFALKNSGFPAAIKIMGNIIRNNNFFINLRLDIHLPGSANIRMRGNLGTSNNLPGELPNQECEIKNNIIEGGQHGISFEDVEVENNPPFSVDIRNNIQYSAKNSGVWIDEYFVNPGLRFYNNVFYDNGSIEEPDNHESGIWISPNCPNDEGDWIQNNILAGNEDVGICNWAGGNPNFANNGFDDNGVDLVNCTSNPSVTDDPLFVDPLNGDFHLYWDSPMINSVDR